MNPVQYLVLAAFVIAMIWIMRIGTAAQLRRLPDGREKLFLARFYVVLAVTFLAGGITRAFQQITGATWLEGFVPVLGGLFSLLLGLPFIWGLKHNTARGVRKALCLVLGVLLPIDGVATICLGVAKIMAHGR